jgi:hypothetical protein
MNELSIFLRNCKSAGLYLNDYESKYLKDIFEENFGGNYSELSNSESSYLLLKEFFDKSTIRYANNNKFLLEKISKEFSYEVSKYMNNHNNNMLNESVGRNLHTAKKKVVGT